MTDVNTNIHVLQKHELDESTSREYYNYREKWFNNPNNFVVEDFPLFLDIEATSSCNLRCPHCVQTYAGFKRGYMKWAMYKRIIDEAVEHGCYGCKYHTIGRGEPLLHKDIVNMIAYAKLQGMIDVYLNTNGSLLTEKKIKGLLDAGLDMIVFSIDGYTKEKYEENRVGTTFERVGWNVEMFRRCRDLHNYSTKIRIQTVALPGLNLDKYTEFWGSRADEITYLDLKDMRNREYGLKGKWICPQPWQRASILWDGTVNICNHDDRGNAVLGNVNDSTVHELWHGSGASYIRNTLKEGLSHLLSACSGCFLRTTEIKKEKENGSD